MLNIINAEDTANASPDVELGISDIKSPNILDVNIDY